MEIYDLIIIGQGPAGYAATIYAKRMGVNAITVGEDIGGMIAKTHIVENYPGFITLSGAELAEKLREHALANGEIKNGRIIDIKKENEIFLSTPKRGEVIKSKAVLIATGAKPKKLNAKGEDIFFNHGVSYCATCDGAFYRNMDVCVIGGGDSAAKESLLLSTLCNQVYIIVRKDKMKAEPINAERVANTKNIKIIYSAEVDEFLGSDKLERVKLTNGEEISIAGAFITIGHDPQTELGKKLGLKMDDHDQIIVDFKTQKTSLDFVYAAGECTNDLERQAIISVGAGTRALLTYVKDRNK